ncbi:MAG: formate--tetrahydrofolate ligase [Candidatus Omnitrophota bacterium]|nr:formate--tetrahydrofolate ligase [Candidatus Omnitrophota bacterium]
MLSDLEIAQNAKIKPIVKIARTIGIREEFLEFYGKYKAKISLDIIGRLPKRENAKYVVVTAITPTPLGEGKTVTTIGLSMALNLLKEKSIVCIRQPSLGPVFGIKGGAAGGGYSQVIPMEDFNLHFTGDVHAVGLAHNLAAAFLDNHIFHGNKFRIDLNSILWRRVLDVSDRSLRNIRIGLGTKEDGIPRDTGFDISVASEVMAILALTTGLQDLRRRLGKIILAYTVEGKPITAEDLKVAGSMAVLLRDAIKPNLIQTLENTPCFVHAGPFANIAHGNSSIIADKIAQKLCSYIVTESGFGADCGAEKFMDIKCRYSGFKPDCVVVVCSIRALKMHSGRFRVVAGKPLDGRLLKEDISAVNDGLCNLKKQIENMMLFGVPVVVAINEFTTDAPKEIEFVKEKAISFGADNCVISRVWAQGSKGAIDLAKAVIESANKPKNFKFLYPLDISIKEKIKIIATKIYGARDVEYSDVAEKKIVQYTDQGFDKLPICMAKTHLSLSHDPNLKGAPQDFILPIRDIRASIGAGFLYPLCGEMRTMPGLPTEPAGERIDIDENGKVVGLF